VLDAVRAVGNQEGADGGAADGRHLVRQGVQHDLHIAASCCVNAENADEEENESTDCKHDRPTCR
jgi:hypothetical protein